MKKWMRGNSRMVLLALSFSLCVGMPVFATQDQIDDVSDNIDSLKGQKKNQEGQLEDLENQKDALSSDARELDEKLTRLVQELSKTQEQLRATGQAIEETEAQLKAAREEEQIQYENMKKRIRFIYESGGWSVAELLLESESFSDFLNQSEYVASIQEYDRRMLAEYQSIRESIAQKEQELEQERQELLALEEQQEEQKNQVETLLTQTREKIAGTENEIAKTQDEISAYEAKIEEQKAYEKQLEEQKAREDAKRLEEIRRQEEELRKQKAEEEARKQQEAKENERKQQEAKEDQQSQDQQKGQNQGDGGPPNTNPPAVSQTDLALLAALIECEAGGESAEGKLAVGSVVMNRVSSSYFPNTVVEVIYQSGQFTPVASGRFAAVLARGANASCISAASQVLNGTRTVDNLYFRTNNGLIDGTVIGNHVFY